MALPVVKSLAACVDYERTVQPYLGQFTDFPQQFIQSAPNLNQLAVLYVSTNPLVTAFVLAAALGPIFLVAAEINRNWSQVDRFWSLLPTIYNAHYALYAYATGLPLGRLGLLLGVSVFWSSRLSYNYWRKGGYSIGSEDYRWEIIKKNIGSFLFFLLDVTFISTYQSFLLCVVTVPTYALLLSQRLSPELTTTDYTFGGLIAFFVAVSAIADQQQWNYQNAKQAYKKSAKVPAGFRREALDRGFLAEGLWAYSRHPNFAAEQSVWLTLYLWTANLTGNYLNWTAIGPVVYLSLFQGSTWFTESITANKYPDYAAYQKRVGTFVPILGLGVKGSASFAQDIQKADKKSQ